MKFLVFILLFVLSGCATVFTGVSDEITFTSKPDNAEVYVDHEKLGITPLIIDIDRELHDSDITFKLDKCDDANYKLVRIFNKWSLANITVWPAWVVDALTGALMKPKFTTYHSDFECIEETQ